MPRAKRAPMPNTKLRKARRELEHRRRERSFLWWFWGGWLGWFGALVANRSEHAQQARLEARHRVRHRPEQEMDEQEPPPPVRAAPRPRDRTERDELRRSARRRHVIQTVLIVGGILIAYLAYMVIRFRIS